MRGSDPSSSAAHPAIFPVLRFLYRLGEPRGCLYHVPGVDDVPPRASLSLDLSFELSPLDREASEGRPVVASRLSIGAGQVVGIGEDGIVPLVDGNALPVEPDLVRLERAVFGPALYDFSGDPAACRHGSLSFGRDAQLPVGLGKVLEEPALTLSVPFLAPLSGEELRGEPLGFGPVRL